MKLNLPCKITLIRIALIPFILFFYLTDLFALSKIVALVLFIIAACTDFVDGYIARKYNMVTNLGKFLDPIADKLIATAGVLLIIFSPVFQTPYGMLLAFIMIARDTIVSLLRQIGANNGIVIAADKLGKIKTVALDLFIPVFMLLDANISLNFMHELLVNISLTVGYLLTFIFIALTVASVVNYVVKNKEIFK